MTQQNSNLAVLMLHCTPQNISYNLHIITFVNSTRSIDTKIDHRYRKELL